jgi:flagellar basal body rod protein FlgG
MPRLVTSGGQRVGDPPYQPIKLGDNMHDIENTFKSASHDASEAAHQMSVGTLSLVNAAALGLRSWANGCAALAQGLTEQSMQMWRQQADAIQQSSRGFERGAEPKMQPGQQTPPRTVGQTAATGTHG